MKQSIVVGLSGGVDSSVTAYFLKSQGYSVECLFMKNWEEDDNEACTSEEDYKDALLVCNKLNLPLSTINFAKEYWDRVFKYFLDEYSAGRTPNPDVLCNKEIKFKLFLDYAMEMGAEKIAMGHYAQVIEKEGVFYLLKGLDTNKDQSYFLYLLNQRQLSKSLFPVGKISKKEVREIAAEQGLITSDKKDSTGICFIGERKFKEFLKNYIPAQPGDITDEKGNVIGKHEGLMYYTIGQRKGLGIGGGHGEDEAPWYVAEKNVDNNTLLAVQGKDHPMLYGKMLKAGSLHWISKKPDESRLYTAKIRYRQADQKCRFRFIENGEIEVSFEKDQYAIAPGQSVVFYDKNVCLGGGIIVKQLD